MMAATRSKRRVAGELPEDKNKNTTSVKKHLKKFLDEKQKAAAAKAGATLAKDRQPTEMTQKIDELPYVEVQPLPSVVRGQPKSDSIVPNQDGLEMMLSTPRIVVEPGFKNKAPLQEDGRAKDLLQEALKNPICITTEDLLNVSEPMRQELKKLLIKKRQEKKSATFAVEVEPTDDDVGTSGQRSVQTIS